MGLVSFMIYPFGALLKRLCPFAKTAFLKRLKLFHKTVLATPGQ
jgi:hypothetical protein